MCSGSIEFQKRDPSHVHVLIWVENFNPTLTEIEKIIFAEILNENSPLHEKVIRMMVHCPCISLNLQSKYMKKGIFKKVYPKPYMDVNNLLDEYYPY